jgi:hypothetical protein
LGSLLDPITTRNDVARLGDQRVGIDPAATAELRHHVGVRAERHRGAVAELFGELDDRQPVFLDAQAREAVPQVVRARAEAATRCQRLELSPAPVLVVVSPPSRRVTIAVTG